MNTVDVPESPIDSGTRGPWQQRCDYLNCHEGTTKCRSFLLSSCNYDLFDKVKEPPWGTPYNTRDELIHALEQSIWNINKDGHADGVRHLPNIWQKVIIKGGDYIEGT